MRIEADGSQLRVEAVSDMDGSIMDSLALRKSEGWAERHMRAMQRPQELGSVSSMMLVLLLSVVVVVLVLGVRAWQQRAQLRWWHRL